MAQLSSSAKRKCAIYLPINGARGGLLDGNRPPLLRVVIRRLLLTCLLGLTTAHCAFAAGTRPQLNAATFDTDPKTGEIVLTGNARAEWENTLLLADEIRYDQKTNTARAIGHVTLTHGASRLLADKLSYHIDNKSYDVENLSLGQYPFYVSGLTASGTAKEVIITNAVISYTEPYPLAPSLRAAKVTYVPDEKVRAETARIGLGIGSPLSLPHFEQSVHEPILSYLDATFGYRGSLGPHLGLGALLPIAPGFKAGGDVSFYSKRGFLLGPSAKYDGELGGQEMSGEFRSGYIHDYGERLQDVLGDPIHQDRGFIDWTHHQAITDRLTVFGQLHYWSDSEVIRDFRPDEFFRIQTPDTFVEGIYTGNNYAVSLFSRLQPDSYLRVRERLPELRFDLAPTPIGLGVYERFQASAAVLQEDAIAGYPEVTSRRFDAYYGLSRPIAPNDWLTLTPVAGARLTHYARAVGGKDDYTRALGEIGFDASLRTSGVYEYKNERWDIDGIRHLLTPRLSYRYIPDAERGQQYIPAFDRDVFTTYLQPLDLGDQRNIDELHRTNTLRIGLDNTFQTRDKIYGSRDLLIVNVAADLRFDRADTERQWSEIHTELAFMPARWLRFDMYQSVNSKDLSVHELNTGVRVLDGDKWSVRFANHYLEHQFEEYIVDARYRLNEAYQVIGRVHYDAAESRFVERSVALRQNIHNLWSIEYGVSFFSGRSRESNFGFSLRIDLMGL
ncbi:hypothetical protein DB347_23605 [Opitutaceae bacterium EW11]|nr:hypothetical protein DB347_23605 [Opitutaceae bacterium EW11]